MSKNSAQQKELEPWRKSDTEVEEQQPQEVQVRRKVAYQAQQDFRVFVDFVTYDLKQGQVIVDADIIKRLLSVSAPILPMGEEAPGFIPCPHCNRKIELQKVPAIKSWLDLQKK